MRIFEILELAKQYIILGCIAAIFVWVIGYVVIYRKIMKRPAILSKKKVFVNMIFICYMAVVIGATMLSRGNSWYQGNVNLHIFSSYREAWNSFSEIEWRNLILNILLFVPMGFLLPILSKRFETFWKTYLVGFGTSIAIELIQFIAGRGIVEIDDVFNNTIGTMIGFGLIMLFFYLIRKRRNDESRKLIELIGLQLPFLFTLLGFSILFLLYHNQEFGNLSSNYCYKNSMHNVRVSSDIDFNQEREEYKIYALKVAKQEEMLNLANQIFAMSGTVVDESQNDVYEDTIVYHSADGNYSVWIDYKGLTTWYTDFSQREAESSTAFTKQEVLQILSRYGIEVPAEADFKIDGQDSYTFTVAMEEIDDNQMVDGQLTCTITKEGKIKGYHNHLISWQNVKKVEVISEQEAFERIEDGKFNKAHIGGDLQSIEVHDVFMIYETDSKGYYQPVYEFSVEINGNEGKLYIPAMR